jgi:hypothetical protein
VIGGFGISGGAAGIAPPFQVVALDEDGAGNLAVSLALPFRAGVDEDRAAAGFDEQVTIVAGASAWLRRRATRRLAVLVIGARPGRAAESGHVQ